MDNSMYQKPQTNQRKKINCLFKIDTVDNLFSVSKESGSVMRNYKMNYE